MQDSQSLLDADSQARSEALDVTRSFIVQAPAGSGKTELLIQRYLRLLSIVESPEEVLAITFTRKAALEMQLRVLKALRSARDGGAAETEHERFTLSLADAVHKRACANDWNLIESPGRMRIETVDAFGAGIARTLPLSSGLGGAGTTAADAEMTTIYRDAATATLDYLGGNHDAGSAVERVLRHLDNNVGLYVSYIARMLSSREQWLAITGAGATHAAGSSAARQRLESNIEDVINRQLGQLDSLLPPGCREGLPPLLNYAGQNLQEAGKTDHLLVAFANETRMPLPEAGERIGWHGIADLLLTKKGRWRKQATKNDGFPADNKQPKQALADIIESLHHLPDLRDCLHRTRLLPDPHYTDEQWEVLLALFELLPLAVAELRRLFSNHGVTDHNEVALSAGRALGSIDEPGDIALMLDYQVQHLLVDEMQDTSIGQYDLLEMLTAGWMPGDGRTIFCVGDPMQSIYRFRDAEVGEFLLSKERGIGNTPLESLTLRRNFRSGEFLVHWFNTVFMQVMPLRDDIASGAISYSESVPIADKAGQGVCHVHALFDLDPDEEARFTLQVVEDCHKQDGGGDIAVLVRSRTQLTGLLSLLRRTGIEYQAVEIDRLTDLPEIVDLIALTRALCHFGDRMAWLALLRGPLAGLKWNDIHALVVNDRHQTVLELSNDSERLGELSDDGRERLQRLLAVLAEHGGRNTTGSLSENVELAWYSLGGPALLGDDEQLENVCRFFRTLSKIEFAGTLDDVVELEQRLDEERVSSAVTNNCRLQIMTMHKAKGLQFDHVVLPALGRMTRGSNREVLRWLNLPDEHGRSEMIISPVGARADLANDPLHQFIEATEKEKSWMELDRLLYVACTRAKRSLHLIGHVGVANDGESCKKPDARSLLSKLWPAVENEYHVAFDKWRAAEERNNDRERGTSKRLVTPLLRRFPGEWRAPVPPQLPGLSGRAGAVVSGDETAVEFYWVGAAARHAGTIVHRWLQRISEGQSEVRIGQLDHLHSTTRRWASNLGVPELELNHVCERAEQALRGILGHDRGQWILKGEGACELPITGVYEGRTESIVIDRVRIDDDGTHWIVDYKTSTHEGGDLAGFIQQESDRYRPQLRKYAAMYRNLTDEPVRTALYFPLLQEFCEVSI